MRIQTPLVYVFMARLFPNELAFTLPFISLPGLPDLTRVGSDVVNVRTVLILRASGPNILGLAHQVLTVLDSSVP